MSDRVKIAEEDEDGRLTFVDGLPVVSVSHEVEAAYIANALAEGQHMTEGSIAEMTEAQQGIVDSVKRGRESLYLSYIETLERAVLALEPLISMFECPICLPLYFKGRNIDNAHLPDCIVPALLEKYPDA